MFNVFYCKQRKHARVQSKHIFHDLLEGQLRNKKKRGTKISYATYLIFLFNFFRLWQKIANIVASTELKGNVGAL